MSPVSEHEIQIWRDKDSFFRNEQGLKHMAHLIALLAVVAGIITVFSGLVAFFAEIDGSVNVLGIGFGSIGTGTMIEGYQTRTESRNMRNQNSSST